MGQYMPTNIRCLTNELFKICNFFLLDFFAVQDKNKVRNCGKSRRRDCDMGIFTHINFVIISQQAKLLHLIA